MRTTVKVRSLTAQVLLILPNYRNHFHPISFISSTTAVFVNVVHFDDSVIQGCQSRLTAFVSLVADPVNLVFLVDML